VNTKNSDSDDSANLFDHYFHSGTGFAQ